MLASSQIEELITMVSAMSRETLVAKCLSFRASFPVDFTPDYLHDLPLDRLRHIFVAMCLQCRQIPEDILSSAA